jgi:hypothetical protein
MTCLWRHSTSITGSSLLIQLNASIDCTGDDLTIYDGMLFISLIIHVVRNISYIYNYEIIHMFLFYTLWFDGIKLLCPWIEKK